MRGKEGAETARRRYQASIEHIDRLADEVVAAKERARRYESDARQVPALRAALTKAQRQVEEGASDALLRERELRQQDLDVCHEKLLALTVLFFKYDPALSPDDWTILRGLVGPALAAIFDGDASLDSRTARRNVAYREKLGELFKRSQRLREKGIDVSKTPPGHHNEMV